MTGADGAFQGPSGRNVQTPAQQHSSSVAFQIEMFVLGRFLQELQSEGLN